MSKELKNYLPVNRKFFEHPFWMKERVYSEAEAWLYLLKEARFEVSETSMLLKGKIVRWGRGELPASLRFLGYKWQWDKNKVDRFLNLLVIENMISKRTATGTDQTIITLCNYDSYNGSGKLLGQQTGQTRDTDGTLTGQTRDNTNKGNNGKKEKNGKGDGFAAPTVQEVRDYFSEKGYTIDAANKAHEYYETAGWKDSKGNQVKNWKQKMIAVWFKDEHKQGATNGRIAPRTPYVPTEQDFYTHADWIAYQKKQASA